MMKRIITFLILWICAYPLYAQVETRGSDFWVTFGNNANVSSSSVHLQLRIVAKQAVTGKITFTESNQVVNFSVPANGVYDYTLSVAERDASYSTSTGTNNKSVRIQTDNNIPATVYAFNTYAALADATNLLPAPVLGSDYYHLGRDATSGSFRDNYMVIATQDNTTLYENGTLVANLSAGQVYFRQANSNTVDMSGYHITSNHPIAYFSAHNYQQINGGGDNIFQQLTSTNTWGTNFIVPVSLRGIELVRIVACQDGTTITQTGATLPRSATPAPTTHTLNAGQWVEWQISLANKGCHIQSDKPVQIGSYMVGKDYGNGVLADGDEALVWIPPVEQSVQTALIAPFGSTNLSTHYALVVTSTATKNNTTIKIGSGQTMLLDDQNGTWYDNPSSGMSFYNLQLTQTTSSYIFDNQEGLIVYGYGFGYYISYYYMAASSMRQLNPSFYINDVHYQNADGQTYCNTSFEFKAELKFPLSTNPGHIKWYINGVEEASAQDQHLWTKPSLPLNIPQEIKMVVTSATNEVLTTTSTIKVIDPHPLEITGSLYICPPDVSTTLTAESGPDRYQWYYNGNPILGAIENTYIVAAANAGNYSVIGQYGTCTSPMSETVTVINGCEPTLEVTYAGNGHTAGTAPVDPVIYVTGAIVTTQLHGSLVRTGGVDPILFAGWTPAPVTNVLTAAMAADTTTAFVREGGVFTITGNTTMYAVWSTDINGNGKPDIFEDYYNVIYNGNGATSGSAPVDIVDYLSGMSFTIKTKGNLVKMQRVFLGWNPSVVADITTQSEENALISSNTMKQPGETFTITGHTSWYAVWALDNDGNEIPDYKQAVITYNRGAIPSSSVIGLPQKQVVAKGTLVLSNMGAIGRYYKLVGWNTTSVPLINSLMMENLVLKMGEFYAVGESLVIAHDMVLHAVWVIDQNNDGKPDYAGSEFNQVGFRRGDVTVFSGSATDNEEISGTRVWSYENTLYIQSDKAVRANIYTLNGMLFKQLNVPEGMTSEPLKGGIYIVEIDGSRYKVVVK